MELVYHLTLITLITILSIILICLIIYASSIEQLQNTTPTHIYCLMVTCSDSREQFAKIAIQNFLLQTHPHKHLIIINHGKYPVSNGEENVFEKLVTKHNRTLGDLRNESLTYVEGDNNIWTPWDDDDWRSENYLQLLYENLGTRDVLLIRNRIEVNLINKFMWKSKLASGYFWCFARKKTKLQYDSLNTLEDFVIKKNIYNGNMSLVLYENDPKLYIRTIHGKNTSIFVDENKYKITNPNVANNTDYTEYEVTNEEQMYVNNILEKYYKNVLPSG